MFNKKIILILTIILTCLLAVSAVSAAENATDDIVGADVSDDVVSVEETTDEVVSVENNNQSIDLATDGSDSLSANPDGTFTDLANDISNANGELILSRNYVYDSSKDSNYKEGIVIDKKISINGKGFIINGMNTAHAFKVSSGNVVLRNIEFINCYSSGSGGAVYWNGANGCLYDCDFINCYSSGSGGAVYWNGANGCLYDCDFMKCYKSSSSSGSSSASNYDSSSGSKSSSGGAVYWAGADGSLFNCYFEDCNNSQYDSYSCSYYSSSLFQGSSSKCTSNSYSYGGAVYWAGKNGNLFDCDFINCYSYSYSYSSDKIYAERTLSYCSVSSSSYSYDSVYWEGKNGNLFDCSFINSTSSFASSSRSASDAQHYAGGYGYSANDPILYFYSYSYSNSYSYGGAVYWAGDNGNLSDCNFITPNSKSISHSYGSGGAVYWYGTDGDLSNCSFMNCRINGGYANAVYWYGANGGLLNCSFVDCKSSSNSGYNGSVYWDGTNGELFNCSFNGDYYNYENYCSKSSSSTVYPVMLIHTFNDGRIVIFECTQLVNNISVTLYNVTGKKVLYDEFDISSDDLTSSYTVNYLEGGEYQMVLHYGGDNFYTSTSTNNLFKTLYKSNIKLDLKNNYIFDEKIPLNYTIAPNCAGIISIYIDNAFKANISVGDAFEFETLNAGEYDITVIYNGDNNFAMSNDSCKLKVSKADPSIDVTSSNLMGEVSFAISLNETATGNVTLILNDINSYHGNLTNGKTNIIVPNLNAGDCSVKIIYNGCKNFNNKTYATTLTIDKIPTTVTATVDDITYTENTIIDVKCSVDGIAIVKIDESYIKNINVIANTIAPVTFENIPVGKHNVTITLKPTNSNYNESTYNTEVTVSKKDASISLKVADSIYGEDVIVNVTAGEDGKVILKVGGIIREKNVLANTLTKINLGVLAAGSYNVELTFDAGENYKPCTKNDNIVISPAKAEILILQAENNVYGDNTIIKVKTNVEGILTFNVGSITRTFDIVANELTSFDFGILDAKTYAVEVSLDAGNNYTKPINTTQVTIESKQTTVDVNVKNSTYGEHVIVNVTASENGEISVNIGDITKYVNVEANKAYSVDFSVLNADSYNVYVSFDGGNNYKKSYNNGFLIVSPAKSQITEIQSPNNSYGENTIIRVKANVGGVLTAKINTITKEVNLNANQLTSIDFGILDANNYEVELSFNAGNNYISTTATKTFKVLKIDPTISVAVTNATYGQAATIIVNSNAEGNATIEIGSVKTYNNVIFKNNIIIQDVTDIDAGPYSVKVTYNGNNNYNVKTYDAKLTINKASTTTVATVDDITYTENTIIDVKCSVDGIAIVKIDESYIKNINVIANTIAPVTFENIPVGKHNVTITLKPSSKNYEESTYNTDFTVSQKETTVNLNVVDLVYGKDVIVNVTASEDGKVILNVGDITREKNVLANIQTTINLGVLSAKSYDAEVSFNAGENYKLSTQQKSFTITPAKAEILTIQSQNNTYGENTIIKVKTNVGGSLTFKSGSIVKSFDIVANKLTSFDLGLLDAKSYNMEVSLDAGSNYTTPSDTVEITISPKQTTVNVNVKDSIYGDNVIVNVSASENGKITVKVGTIIKDVNVEANKVYSIDFSIMDAKSYVVNATFNGGNNYEESHDDSSLTVSPAQSKITEIQALNKIYGEEVTVNVKTDSDGSLTAKIGNITKVVNVIANQFTSINFGVLDVNTYDVTLNLNAGSNYISDNNSTKVKVSPKVVLLTLDVVDSVYGSDVIVNVTSDYAGEVILKVGDIIKPVVVSANKVTSVNLGILNASVYDCELNMDLNDNFIVNKATSSLTVNSKVVSLTLDVVDSVYGENVIVNVSASENGKITVKVGTIIKDLDAAANKLTSFDFGILDVNDYEVTASFNAGNNYASSPKVDNIKVTPKQTDLILNVKEYESTENVVVNVTASEKGNVTIKCGSIVKTDVVAANTVVSFDLGVLPIGSYELIANFVAGTNYINSSDSATIKVLSKLNDENITISIPEITSGAENNIQIKLPVDATGTATLTIDNKEYPFSVYNGVANIKTPKLDEGNYEYNITYSGDNKYASFTKSGSLTVNPTPTQKPIDEKDISIPSLDGGSGIIKLPSDANGTITLDIAGKKYDFPVVNGVANIKLPDLTNGNYGYILTYSGDGKYFSFSKTGSLTVNKQTTPTKPVTKTTLTLKKVKVKRSAKKLTIQATLKINGKAVKGKIIKFKFNKKSYKAKTNVKGVAKITVKKSVLKKLKKGKKVTYTATYGKITKKVTVKVKK